MEDGKLFHQSSSGTAANTVGSTATSSFTDATSQIQFCRWNLLACINCSAATNKLLHPSKQKSNVAVPSSETANLSNPGIDKNDTPSTTTSSNEGEGHRSTGTMGTIQENDNEGIPINSIRKTTGPVLLELKKIQYRPNRIDDNQYHSTKSVSLFDITAVCLSRGNPSLGSSVSSTCLDTWKHPDRSFDDGNCIPLCATGLSTGALCIHSFAVDATHPNDEIWNSNIEYYYAPRNHRPATAVAWKPVSNYSGHHHIAVGFTGGASTSAQTIQSTASVARPISGVREYCCFVWDIEHQQQSPPLNQTDGTAIISARRTKTTTQTPLFTLSHQTAVASLAWLLENGQTLAIGGQQRNMQLYDLRIDSNSAGTPPVFTIYAHNHGVHGIEPNPYRPWQFVSWSRAPGEAVKVWDARRMDSPLICDIKLSGNNYVGTIPGVSTKPVTTTTDSESHVSTSTELSGVQVVTGVKWSGETKGSLSVVLGGTTICIYDTSSAANNKLGPISTIQTKQPLLDVAHYPFTSRQTEGSDPKGNTVDARLQKRLMTELFPKRMAVVYSDRSVHDVAKHRNAPICISHRDGRFVHSLGRTLWIRAGVSKSAENDDDISIIMMRRARCINEFKYSMDTNMNIALFLAEDIECKLQKRIDAHPSTNRNELLRLWKWIDLVERLCSEIDPKDELRNNTFWSSKTLVDSGAWNILRFDDGVESEIQQYSNSLCCTTYESERRIAVLTSCGWTRNQDLDDAILECEELGEYERSAALAVWSGEIGLAVETLQRGADSIRKQIALNNSGEQALDGRFSLNYAQILELVSLSIVGYRGGDKDLTSSQVWRKSCIGVLQRRELSEPERMNGPEAYLRQILTFLISIGVDDSHEKVLEDNTICLSDRVAFACRFLSHVNLKSFLQKQIDDGLRTGSIEAIALTGLGKQGIQIVQSYVDRTSDVQTAALLTSRVVLPIDWVNERRITAEWLQSYRSLLNTWQMWQSRAIFDVDRAQLLRKYKQRQTDSVTKLGAVSNVSGRRSMSLSRRFVPVVDPDIQASVPAQLDARCNYCSAQLGLRKKQDTKPESWLSNMKNVISCCPNCRKPLPRCAICMLQLGALNPYAELKKEQSRTVRTSPNDDLSSLASLPFAEWFTWCVRCKHGGHAHHMVGWFAKHNVCPVSGCSCNCQFDAIKRPTSNPNLVVDGKENATTI